MARPGHRAETHGGWTKRQPEPGYFVHRSPNGYVYLVTNQGTLALGRTAFSAAVWQARTETSRNPRISEGNSQVNAALRAQMPSLPRCPPGSGRRRAVL